MLSEEEELRLEYIIEEIGTEGIPDITEMKWIVSRLKEINNEASKYAEELQTTNEQLARVMEHYEG